MLLEIDENQVLDSFVPTAQFQFLSYREVLSLAAFIPLEANLTRTTVASRIQTILWPMRTVREGLELKVKPTKKVN